MKKIYLLSIAFFAFLFSHAQVTGTKVIGVDYPTIAAAVTALNTSGVGAGGATINVPAGYTETAPSGGYLLGTTLLNVSLSAANPLTFAKSGTGANPILTAFTGGSSVATDGIFKIAGSDYVTINGIDIRENAANTGAAQMEWGYALVNLNATGSLDGCQNFTLRNCTITLDRTNPNGSFGIYCAHNIATSATVLTVAAVADAHSNNKFYSNTLTNVTEGIWLSGYADGTSPYTYYDQNNDVGGASAATGNTVTNLGVTASFNTFCIYAPYQNNVNISYNTIDNGANGTPSSTTTLFGIYVFGTTANATVSNNNIKLTQTGGSSLVYGINSGVTGNEIMTNNTFSNFTLNTTGNTYFIYASNAANNITCTGNVSAGTTNRAGTSGNMYGYYNFGSPTGGTATITNNNFSNIVLAGASGFFGIFQATAVTQVELVNNNTISNVTGGTTISYGIYHGYGAAGSQAKGNTVSNISSTGPVTGMYLGYLTAGVNLEGSGNNINTLSTTGAAAVIGINTQYGTLMNVFKNKIYNLLANNAGGTVNGIAVLGGTNGSTTNIYNNLIGDLRAPVTSSTADAIRGINITSVSTTSPINVYYNTVYIGAASTGTNFSTSALFSSTSGTATTAALTFKNNIFYNNSTANGSGTISAYRRSSATLGNYVSSSNNLLYAGPTGTANVLFYDGTTGYQTIAAYQVAVTPRDVASVTELSTPFLSTTGGGPTFLHINPSVGTLVESGGANIAAVTDDYDGDTRNATTPDIGADEFAGITPTACTGTPTAGTITGVTNICQGTNTILTLNGYTVGATGISIQWKSSSTMGGPYTNIAGANGSTYNTGVITPGITVYYVVTVTCANGGGNATTAEFSVTSNANPTAVITPAGSTTICAGSSLGLTASGGVSYSWSPSAGLNTTSGATVTATPAATTTYTVVVTNASNCTSTATVTVTVLPVPVITSVTASPNAICAGSTSQLQAVSPNSTLASGYTFTGGTTTYTTITGTTLGATAIGDDVGIGNLPIGFTFRYNNTDQTVFAARSNGLIELGQTAAAPTGFSANSLAGNANCIAPLWDDNNTTGGSIIYATTGIAPNRVLTVQWTAMHVGGSGSTTTPTINVQTKLYEADGRIELIYGTTSAALSTTTASIGISGTVGNYLSVTPLAPANTSTVSSSSENSTISSATNFPAGTLYTFVPPASVTYNWTPAASLSNATISNPVASPVVTTIYTVTVTGTNTCTTSANITVTVNNPTAYAVTGGGAYCAGGTGVVVGLANSQSDATYQLVLNGTTNVGAPVNGTGTAISFGAQTVAGTYTVVATRLTCTSNMTGSVTIIINPVPVVTATFVQPTTCTSTDGAIDITVTGGAGPFTYAWTGNGVIAANEDQTGLTAGNYSVTVTNTATSCVTTANFTLNGPGGCAVCPTIPTLTPAPTTATCIGSNVTLTASGLTSMGVTYGIQFKYFAAPTATPYTGGTTIATVANGALTGGGTTAATTTTFPAAGTYYVYAILSPLPVDPSCRPSATATVVINPTPTVNAVTSQTVCNAANTNAVVFTGNISGTICGTAAEGGAVTLSAPAGTVITAINFASYGTPNGSCGSFTVGACNAANSVSVVSAAAIGQNTVTIQASNATFGDPCNGTAKRLYIQATYSSATPEVFNWTNNTPSIGLAASGTGNIASFAGTNTTTAPVTATITVTPSYTSGGGTCTGTPTTFTITVNPLATVTAVANQTVCRNANTTAVNFTSPTTGGTIVYNWTNSNTAIGLAGSGTGNIASFVGTNTTTAPLTSTITVTPSYTNGAVTCTGTAVSFTITVNPTATVNTVANQTVCNNTSTTAVNFTSPTTGGAIVYNWTNNTPSIGLAATGTGNIAAFTAVNTTTAPVVATITVTPSYTNNATTCTGTPITFTITVNPTPAATIAYTGSPYCTSAGTATVTRTGTAGGVYSSTAGLTLNATTGDVTLGTSTAGTYTVTYTIAAAGGCAAFTTTASITITSAFTATISYPAAPYCINGGSAAVTRTGTAGGTYTSTAGLVINAATGAVDLNTSTAGTYTVTYTINASGGCPLFSTTTTITINSLSVAPIAAVASNPTICANSGVTNLSVTGGTLGTGASYKWYTGSCGGTLFGTGATLTNVTLFSTTTFYVRAEGPCGNTTCASVTVNVNPAPSVTLVASNSNNVTPSSHTTLNASVSPAGNYLFQFFRNGVSVFLTTNTANQVVLPVSPDSAGSYTVQVINIASGCSATAGPVVITSNNTSNVFIAPNPNHGKFSVKYYATGAEINAMRSVAVYDGRGARVFDKTMKITGTYTSMDVDITHSASGTYFVKVSDANGKILSSTAVLVMP